MRWISVFAGLSTLMALVALIYAAHYAGHLAPENAERVHLAAFMQLGVAAIAFALSNRTGMLNVIAAALMLLGAGLFAKALFALALFDIHILILAPIGGITLLIGTALTLFTKPNAKN